MIFSEVNVLKVKAKRNDSWMGIKRGKIYNAELHASGKIIVHTDGYIVIFSEKDFEEIN